MGFKGNRIWVFNQNYSLLSNFVTVPVYKIKNEENAALINVPAHVTVQFMTLALDYVIVSFKTVICMDIRKKSNILSLLSKRILICWGCTSQWPFKGYKDVKVRGENERSHTKASFLFSMNSSGSCKSHYFKQQPLKNLVALGRPLTAIVGKIHCTKKKPSVTYYLSTIGMIAQEATICKLCPLGKTCGHDFYASPHLRGPEA